MPEVNVAPAPALDSHEVPTSPDDDESWSVRIGEVFDFGEGGSFTVKERLGRGGMGEVYRAEYVAPHAKKFVQVFALKVLRPDALARQERSFIDEVHLLSLLRHNNIARYHTFFLDKGRKVLVMEYVDGRSLHSILNLARRKGRTISESTSLELLAQIAWALSYTHAAKDEAGRPLNIVHRDVSPTNIMVNTSGFAMLVDFGVAKADLEGRTQTITGALNIRGKFPYVSPEQVEGKPLDSRSDLFSLCSVLVEMLTGEPPFGRALHPITLQSTVQVTPRYVDHVTRRLSKKVRAICQEALAHDPNQRFANGREMATAMLANHSCQGPEAIQKEIAALEALPDAAPVVRQEQVATDLRLLKRKHRALAAISALAFAGVAAFYLWGAYHSRPTAVSHEQPMLPSAHAEEGKPIVNDELKPQAPASQGANDAPASPTGAATAKSRTKKMLPVMMTLCAATGCVHIHTGAKAGDCTHEVVRKFEGKHVPELFHVQLADANPNGNCTGERSPAHLSRDEPCPVYEAGPIFVRVIGDSKWEAPWYGPYDNPKYADRKDPDKHALLIGQTRIFEATGPYNSLWGHGIRNVSKRMTALITEIRTYDGKKVPVCGVLFGDDDKEGVPIYSSPYFETPTGGAWGNAKVRFFWPSP